VSDTTNFERMTLGEIERVNKNAIFDELISGKVTLVEAREKAAGATIDKEWIRANLGFVPRAYGVVEYNGQNPEQDITVLDVVRATNILHTCGTVERVEPLGDNTSGGGRFSGLLHYMKIHTDVVIPDDLSHVLIDPIVAEQQAEFGKRFKFENK